MDVVTPKASLGLNYNCFTRALISIDTCSPFVDTKIKNRGMDENMQFFMQLHDNLQRSHLGTVEPCQRLR